MELYATLRTKVDVDPLRVIEALIDQTIGARNWVFEEDGNYYKGYEASAGSHSFDDKTEISKEKYDYIQALLVVKNYLRKIK